MHGEDHLRASEALYERALFEGDSSALAEAATHLDAAEADLSLARGRVLHGEFLDQRRRDPSAASADPRELELFERAVQLYREVCDERGEGEALFWVGCFHQVVRHDDRLATTNLERSFELATRNGDVATASDALRHLGIAEHSAGRLEAAKERLEASTKLRRQAGNQLGVASNLVGLIYVAAAQGRRDDAATLTAQARAIAELHGARVLLSQIDEAAAQ